MLRFLSLIFWVWVFVCLLEKPSNEKKEKWSLHCTVLKQHSRRFFSHVIRVVSYESLLCFTGTSNVVKTVMKSTLYFALGCVLFPTDFAIFLFCFFDYTPVIDGIHEIRLALNVRSIENIKFGKLKIDKTVPDSSEYWTAEHGNMKAILMKPNGTIY
jgi:hypothetical protein